ncbi:hypothetical protein CANCADRAFT_29600 [Tortispora caseinolytica NRRL Y-17796]|uniref:poly(A)-specific ribonuclease n=1 Tax=Tortispora caseinolytica NRRL Y-17796 TaxID=767744 RepID=A0A1E4T9B4_9ASCO|nr:hypothetical protein CANCADRAFT_29600 [Tortispora caseinolytica NRRL Y-17796]
MPYNYNGQNAAYNTQPSSTTVVRQVWATNLERELALIRDYIEVYPVVALDAEFPGVVARPIGNFNSTTEYHYQTMRCNIDMMRVLQIGITLSDERGNRPEPCTWQFNFKFSVHTDMYSAEGIDVFAKAGVDFAKHENAGIDFNDFAELLISSGLVLEPKVRWVSYHGGYDFGFLLSLMLAQPLPETLAEFLELLHIFFPSFFDVKYLVSFVKPNLRGSINDLAEQLYLPGLDQPHKAGPESYLTSTCYFELCYMFFQDGSEEAYNGFLFGLGPETEMSRPAQAYPLPS